ncbi:MAG TPA: hypothetical protein VMS17_17830 [Gemmataceae bacterium]|nr:hypothetical protein [Gemmataceae bacterium]
MRPRRWAAVALRALQALHKIRRLADDALAADLAHSQLVCTLAEAGDVARRALRRWRRKAA